MSSVSVVAPAFDAIGRPSEIAARICERIERCEQPVWISRIPSEDLLESARALDEADPSLPLYGHPFAVKDNIDVAGLPTTAGCPGASRLATEHAPVVQRLLDAGALLVGKTNMDQFATGLVGTRSPYGACSSVFDVKRVSGGSSSGSAVAVALGLVSFALGTDTAGSGRVPAAFNGVVGVKPTRGLLSTRGVLPACASLDCVSIFSSDVSLGASVLHVLADRGDLEAPRRGRIGVPVVGQAEPTQPEAAAAWALAHGRAAENWMLSPVDVIPLLQAAPLLYEAWIAERSASLGSIIDSRPDGLDPTVAAIVRGGADVSGAKVFAAMHRLTELRAQVSSIWDEVDALLMPTAPFHPTHAEVASDPIGVNERLGAFTNFANLFDLAAIALPGPMRCDGLPFGVTLFGPALSDRRLLELGALWLAENATVVPRAGTVTLAVAGAHMRGLPLNYELTTRGARFVGADRTAPVYRLLALPGAGVRRPGLVRSLHGGASIDVELWEITPAALGSLLTGVPAPLAIGRVGLADGGEVPGFVCEGHATADAEDITAYGGWRAYLEAVAS